MNGLVKRGRVYANNDKITDTLDVVIASLNLAKVYREGKIYLSLYSSPLVKSKNDDRVDS